MNKLNQYISNIANRDADVMANKPFSEWCAIAESALEMQPKKKSAKPVKRR